ncbi:MAG: hypothetical protein K9J82_18410 [Methylotenera sp.]|jgi:hypothetical protein|nr:hypothetical protein [Methylotenera sp.]
MSTPNPYAPPQADVLDLPQHEAAPPLWNPNAAASWSLLFSPIFGAWLHMKNWQAMGETEKAATSKTWLVTITVFLILLVLISVVLPESKGVDALARFGGFGLLVAWYYQIGKSQNAFVLARYGKGYPRKGWLKPLGIALLAWIAFFLVAVVIGVIAGIASGQG